MSKCNLIHLWWGGKFHWKLPPAVTLHSGLPKRPITKYYLHNLLLHNLPLRQSYFPLLSFVRSTFKNPILRWKKNPSAKANDSKVYLFPEEEEGDWEQRRKFQMTFNLMPTIRLLLYYTTIWLQFKPLLLLPCCSILLLLLSVWNNMVR